MQGMGIQNYHTDCCNVTLIFHSVVSELYIILDLFHSAKIKERKITLYEMFELECEEKCTSMSALFFPRQIFQQSQLKLSKYHYEVCIYNGYSYRCPRVWDTVVFWSPRAAWNNLCSVVTPKGNWWQLQFLAAEVDCQENLQNTIQASELGSQVKSMNFLTPALSQRKKWSSPKDREQEPHLKYSDSYSGEVYLSLSVLTKRTLWAVLTAFWDIKNTTLSSVV